MAITLAQGNVGPVTDWLSSFVGAAATANAGGLPVTNVAPHKVGESVIVPAHPGRDHAWQLQVKRIWPPQHLNVYWPSEQLHVARLIRGSVTPLPVLRTRKMGSTVMRRSRLGVWPVSADSCFVLSPPERGIKGALKLVRQGSTQMRVELVHPDELATQIKQTPLSKEITVPRKSAELDSWCRTTPFLLQDFSATAPASVNVAPPTKDMIVLAAMSMVDEGFLSQLTQATRASAMGAMLLGMGLAQNPQWVSRYQTTTQVVGKLEEAGVTDLLQTLFLIHSFDLVNKLDTVTQAVAFYQQVVKGECKTVLDLLDRLHQAPTRIQMGMGPFVAQTFRVMLPKRLSTGQKVELWGKFFAYFDRCHMPEVALECARAQQG